MISIFWLKKLQKMIKSEDEGISYDLNERFAPTMLDLGLIELRKWSENHGQFLCCCSSYVVTDQGRKLYQQWINEGKPDVKGSP